MGVCRQDAVRTTSGWLTTLYPRWRNQLARDQSDGSSLVRHFNSGRPLALVIRGIWLGDFGVDVTMFNPQHLATGVHYFTDNLLLTDIINKMTCVKFSPDIVDGSPAGKLSHTFRDDDDDATQLCASLLLEKVGPTCVGSS